MFKRGGNMSEDTEQGLSNLQLLQEKYESEIEVDCYLAELLAEIKGEVK